MELLRYLQELSSRRKPLWLRGTQLALLGCIAVMLTACGGSSSQYPSTSTTSGAPGSGCTGATMTTITAQLVATGATVGTSYANYVVTLTPPSSTAATGTETSSYIYTTTSAGTIALVVTPSAISSGTTIIITDPNGAVAARINGVTSADLGSITVPYPPNQPTEAPSAQKL